MKNKKSGHKRVWGLILIGILLFIVSGRSPAQEAGTVAEGGISMDFQEAQLKDVLKVFSQQAGLNFVASESIKEKRVTLYLDNVTIQDALDSIMKSNNLIYEQAPGSSIFIVKESGKAKIDLLTKIYTLGFARVSKPDSGGGKETGAQASQVSDIKPILEKLLSKGEDGQPLGNIIIDKRTNSLIVTSIPEDFPLIDETIKRLDTITPQALIEAEIVEIETGALKNLGLEWGGSSDGAFVRFTGPVKITNFPFIRNKNPFSRSLLGSASSTSTTTTDTSTTVNVSGQDPTRGVLSLAEFSVVLKALETQGMAKFLAKPRIMAINNEEAIIDITADSAVGVKKTNIKDTGEVIEEAERKETGIMLKVTPTINKEGYITMTLEPSVSRAAQSPFFANFVDATKRSVKTIVMAKNGQTVAIGGLIKSIEEDNNRQTPWLSNLPLLGNIFKMKEKQRSDTELIIFITAYIIKDVGEVATEIARAAESGKPGASISEEEKPMAEAREEEIKKTVVKLRKKRELTK